jgi:ankyrin repeat protein
MKLTQIKRVELALKEHGFVSRNHFLDLPYNKITRLSDIILKLRALGWDITTEETDKDTLYHCKPKKIERYIIPITREVFEKKIWQ